LTPKGLKRRAEASDIPITHPTKAIVSLTPMILKSIAIEVVHTAVDVIEKAIAIPIGNP
jgi:hypothetical protein